MSLVSVVAIRDFEHGGRQFREGEAVEVEGVEAAALARLGVVTLNPRARPVYQTRDMVPVDPPLTVPIGESIAAKVPERRRGRRKKIEPEEPTE